eukprot:EC714666.1.p2 GENE.EC714666.1~~EC714666.1.p2  ORF type:complete len:72 (+),score=7.64 EC714666.1:225-440(+)
MSDLDGVLQKIADIPTEFLNADNKSLAAFLKRMQERRDDHASRKLELQRSLSATAAALQITLQDVGAPTQR